MNLLMHRDFSGLSGSLKEQNLEEEEKKPPGGGGTNWGKRGQMEVKVAPGGGSTWKRQHLEEVAPEEVPPGG